MGQITLSYEDSKRILDNPDSSGDARVIAACFIAFYETNNHLEEIDLSTRAIVQKLAHMTTGLIYDSPRVDQGEM